MNSNFGQIPLLTTELAVLERLKKCRHFFSVAIDQIHFKFVGNEDMRTSSNFGQIGPPTTELSAHERLKNTTIDL